ncbi:MAG: SIMPL domain-containing protein [Bacteroidales bacterium]|nr:SIMPL domain-containing protein [Bacteroidales bacterium]
MKRLILSAAIAILSISSIFAQNTTPQQEKFIEVSVRVNKEVIPDEIFINITINEKDNKGKISVEQQEKSMIKALEGLGIDVKEGLTVDDMASSLQKYALRKDNILVSKNYILKVSSAQQAAKAIGALNGLDIARVSMGKVSISDELERDVKNQLLTEAARKAMENAGILAQAVGSKAGKAIYMQNYYSFDSAANGRVMMKAYGTMDAATTVEEESVELEVSKQNLSINVTCKFQLLD